MDTGTRPSEAFQLTVQDFDIHHLSVTILATVSKTRQSRLLPLSPETIETIKKLIRVRPEDWEPDLPVFCNSEGGRFKPEEMEYPHGDVQ